MSAHHFIFCAQQSCHKAISRQQEHGTEVNIIHGGEPNDGNVGERSVKWSLRMVRSEICRHQGGFDDDQAVLDERNKRQIDEIHVLNLSNQSKLFLSRTR